ncbi:hypothetical protein VDGE_30568 [Verticillium dahliae]|uniref:Uncharacterized protein n=1 Tax=Verticillium dahliae TaxID=27337 RepID=A0A444RP37_VERDA|nr:hypothetical protein VDGE_30568 [Verticillium dahliae]
MPRHSSDPGAPATPGTWRQSMVHGSPQCIKPKVEVLGTKEYLGTRTCPAFLPASDDSTPLQGVPILSRSSWQNFFQPKKRTTVHICSGFV